MKLSDEDRQFDQFLKAVLPPSYNSFPRRKKRAAEVLEQMEARHPERAPLPPGGAEECLRLMVGHPNPSESVLGWALQEARSDAARKAERSGRSSRRRISSGKFEKKIRGLLNEAA
jgi:hypothetical protein